MTSYNKTLYQKRENQHKQIRRQYIETFTKNRRKQLMQENESYFQHKHQNSKQVEYQQYFSSLTLQTFKQNPNNHLQYLVEILSQQKNKILRNNLSDMLIMVHGYLIEVFVEQRGKIDYLKELMRQNKVRQGEDLLNELIMDILVYNQVFFEPMYGSRQRKFGKQQEYQSNIDINRNNSSTLLQDVSNKKLNIYLLLDFLMAITYEITPSLFINSLKSKSSTSTSMDNGYDLLVLKNSQQNANNHNGTLNNNNIVAQNYRNDDSLYIQQLINIINDVYKMTLTLFKITLHFRYQIHTLENISTLLKHIYNKSPSTQSILQINSSTLPVVWFDNQRLFMKESVKSKISGRCLQIIVNITALLSMNKQLDQFIHSLMILSQIDALAQDNGFIRQEISQLINLYSNLIDEQIPHAHSKTSTSNYSSHKSETEQISSQIEQEYNNQHILQQPPGIYVFLLEMIAENSESQEEVGNVVYILKVILESYQVPSREENIKILADQEYLKAENSQLILSLYHAEAIAQILSSIFSKLTQNQYQQIPYLSELFIQVTQKMLTYLLYLHQLPEILHLVIRNQNKRMFQIHSKSSHSTLGSIVSQTQEKHKSMVTQNLKQILVNTKQVLVLFSEESLQQNSTSKFERQLNYHNEAIPKDLIECVIELWQQNQIEYCYGEFLEFICVAVEYFPQYMILTDSKQRNQHFLDLVDEIPSNPYHFNQTYIFIKILQFTLSYIQSYGSKLTPKNSLSKYFIDFKSNWNNILQHLEGLLYDPKLTDKSQQTHSHSHFNSNISQFSPSYQTIESLYENINAILKFALENMQIEI